jgi:hypothetical protein
VQENGSVVRRCHDGSGAWQRLDAGGARRIPGSPDEARKNRRFKDGVLKVNIPRSDVQVTIHQRPAPTPFGFGGWVALTKGSGGTEVLMGDLVLTEDEVNRVMSAILENGLDVTALHNHFFWEQPRIFYMHVHGSGSAADLARRLKPAIDLIDQGQGFADDGDLRIGCGARNAR